jgi:hypothetical protein
MGGLVTFIISGIDERVDASIPMISAGNLKNSLTSGSLLNGVVEPRYQINSPEMDNIIKWFDPIAYARLISKPVLMMFGTDDQFFPLISMMDTIQEIHAELTLNIVPNWGHGVLPEWSLEIIRWVDQLFRDGAVLPEIAVSYQTQTSFQGATITVDVAADNADSVFLCWRSSEPGAVWFFTQLPKDPGGFSDSFTGAITPVKIGKVFFFVVAIQDDSVRITSRIFVGAAGSIFFPLLLVVSSISILLIIHYGIWEPKKIHYIREIPYIFGILTLSAGFLLPLYTISGRAELSVFGFVELYGESFLLGGWFLPTIFTSLCVVLALSAFRHRFQFRIAVFVWLPMLVVTIVLYFIFSGVFTFFGSIFLINTGIGALPLLSAIPLMQVLDRYLKTHTNIHLSIER